MLHAECWFNARAARARLQRLQAGWGGATRPAGLLPGRGARGASEAEALRRGREAGAAFHQVRSQPAPLQPRRVNPNPKPKPKPKPKP